MNKTLYDYLPESYGGGTVPDSISPISGGVDYDGRDTDEKKKMQIGDMVTIKTSSSKCAGKSGEVERISGNVAIVKFNDKSTRSFNCSDVEINGSGGREENDSHNRALRNLRQLAGLL